MFFLGKAFQMRGKAHGDDGKLFMEHLEELRITITKIVVTLLIATVGSWIFKDKILEVINLPVVTVWNSSQSAKLPTQFNVDQWEDIKRAESAAQKLPEQYRADFYTHFEDPNMPLYAEAFTYFHAGMQIPDEEKRKTWLATLTFLPTEQRELVHELIEKQPNLKLNAKSQMVDMKSLKPTETFMLSFKLALYTGIIISFPLILWFILEFVLPGMHTKEKKVMWPAMLIGFGLFLTGCLFSYFIVLPQALNFFFEFGKQMGVENQWRIGEYAGFVTQFTIIFGLAFELPVLVITLVKLGLVNYSIMSRTRSYAVLAIVIIAAAITPGSELLSLCLLAVPMYLLYEFSVVYAFFHQRKEDKKKRTESEESGVRTEPKISTPYQLLGTEVSSEMDEIHEISEETLDEHENFDEDHDDFDEDHEEIEDEEDFEARILAAHEELHEGENYMDEEDEYDTDLENVDTEGEEDLGDSDSYEENLIAQEEEKKKNLPPEDTSEETPKDQ